MDTASDDALSPKAFESSLLSECFPRHPDNKSGIQMMPQHRDQLLWQNMQTLGVICFWRPKWELQSPHATATKTYTPMSAQFPAFHLCFLFSPDELLRNATMVYDLSFTLVLKLRTIFLSFTVPLCVIWTVKLTDRPGEDNYLVCVCYHCMDFPEICREEHITHFPPPHWRHWRPPLPRHHFFLHFGGCSESRESHQFSNSNTALPSDNYGTSPLPVTQPFQGGGCC